MVFISAVKAAMFVGYRLAQQAIGANNRICTGTAIVIKNKQMIAERIIVIEVALFGCHFLGRFGAAFFIEHFVAKLLAGENFVFILGKANLKPLKLFFVTHDNTLSFNCTDFAQERREERVKAL